MNKWKLKTEKREMQGKSNSYFGGYYVFPVYHFVWFPFFKRLLLYTRANCRISISKGKASEGIALGDQDCHYLALPCLPFTIPTPFVVIVCFFQIAFSQLLEVSIPFCLSDCLTQFYPLHNLQLNELESVPSLPVGGCNCKSMTSFLN